MTSQSPSFRRIVGRGTAWSTLDVLVGRLGQFAQGVIVARIVAPKEFGVFAIALVVHAVVVNISELGVAAALIRADRGELQRSAPTVATISLVTGCLLGAAVAVLAPGLASGLGSSQAAAPIAIMALNLPLAGVTAVPAALLKRDFRMKRLFVADTLNMLVSAVLVIVLALAGWGALALAWSWVAGQLATTVLLCAHRATWFWPGWSRREARRLLAFGLPLAGANLLAFLVLNVDYVVVGRMLGANALGLYMLAFNISGWPINVCGTVIRSVSLPAFARIRLDGGAMPDHFLRALRLIAAITTPLCLVIGGLAQPAVEAIYGTRWAPAASALVGLSVLAAGRILFELSGDFLVSLGRTRALMLAQLPWLAALIVVLVLVARPYGIRGVGVGQAVVTVCVVAPVYVFLLRHAGVRALATLRAVLPAVVGGVLAASAAHLVSSTIANPFGACAAGGAAGVAVAALPFLWPQWRRRAGLPDGRRARAARVALMEAGETAVRTP